MNQFIKSGFIGLIAIAVVGTPVALHAQAATNAPAAEKKAAKKPNQAIPFHGKVKAIDDNAKTLSVGTETFQVTHETKIIKMGKPATLTDGAVDEEVAGSYHKDAQGKLNAVSIRFGPKPVIEPSNTKTNKP
jgi:hypothetical protein